MPFSGGENLEDRLRNLILNNSNLPPAQIQTQQTGSNASELPRTMKMVQAPTDAQEAVSTYNTPSPMPPGARSSPGARRRPNQAQRRQMDAQMTFPIGTRPSRDTSSTYGAGPFEGHRQMSSTNPPYHGYSQARPQPPPLHQYQENHSPRFQDHRGQGPQTQRMQFSPDTTDWRHNRHQSGPGYHFQNDGGSHKSQQSPSFPRPHPKSRQLYQPGMAHSQGYGLPLSPQSDDIDAQSAHLEKLVQEQIPLVSIAFDEESEKEDFRARIEEICRLAIAQFEREEFQHKNFDAFSVELTCFGSMKSGFATRSSDMDLALLTPNSNPAPDCPESRIPRILERKLLDLGYGARLLTRTRVPIIKLCQKPTEKLLEDLREERAKWDTGYAHEHRGGDEETDGLESTVKMENKSKIESLETQRDPTTPLTPVHTSADTYEEKLSALRQKQGQSLGDYYNSAKKVLRRLGGRDVTASSSNLSNEESKILNDVCRAFISGLYSRPLSLCLQGYRSVLPLFDLAVPFVQRSLHGVWLQVEGERFAMAWSHRPLQEYNNITEADGQSTIHAWLTLQDKYGELTETASYNRQLFSTSEKLKKISSLQLALLEQFQHEEPIHYGSRAQKILEDLTEHSPQITNSVESTIIIQYINGIRNDQIRKVMDSQRSEHSLEDTVNEHRKLQLADDFEHALKLEFYDGIDNSAVERYIALLRGHTLSELIALATRADSPENALIAKIRRFPDPSEKSPLKPRDRYKDHLEFPKVGIGIQCDINFSAHLAIHNTHLLRCYSHIDPRVRLMILFIKNWAKVRGINTPYRGTLSSYGYVLMVLHYLVNVASPFVCPNLQAIHRSSPTLMPPDGTQPEIMCNGWDVRFWRNETEIKDLASRNRLNENQESVGHLLRGFFEYFAQGGPMSTLQRRGFDWGRDVLSLRNFGGIMSKQEKGWVGARTVVETTNIAAPPTVAESVARDGVAKSEAHGNTAGRKMDKLAKTMEETKEIRHRYLFALEDPFETDHNVARTVTHNGIVSIRDEFRRAWRIIKESGKEVVSEGLLDPLVTDNENKKSFQELMDMIHGPPID